MNLPLLKLLTDWTRRTELVLRLQKKRLGVDDTNELDKSLSGKVRQQADAMLESELAFLVRGRMVDMGAGRARKIESRATNAELLTAKTRKPKKWYSRAYYGRINDLQGIIGFQLMESAINAVKGPLDE